MEEIEKLRTRVEKDPQSRLFLPLAEEYRKSGMLDEAISVILRGLEQQPGYTSARVALGRLYLEKDMISEAKNEFENVVKTIPDNLFSHKKLAEIYMTGGETQKAINEYNKVLLLNPLDEDAKAFLEEAEGQQEFEEVSFPSAAAEGTVQTEIAAGVEGTSEGAVEAEIAFGGEEDSKGKVVEEEHRAEAGADFEEFKASFGQGDEETGGQIEDIFPSGTEEEDVIELPDETGGEASFEDVFGLDSEIVPETVPVSVESCDSTAETPSEDKVDVAAADSFVASGNYYKAMETYRKILAINPDDKEVLQRVVELKTLLKLIGKGDEVLIGRLDAFLGAIKRNFERSR